MAVSVSIQETTIMPANEGYVVQIGISDGPLDASESVLRLTLRVKIGRIRSGELKQIQLEALNAMVDALKPLMNHLY
jgi:hypothetical protein